MDTPTAEPPKKETTGTAQSTAGFLVFSGFDRAAGDLTTAERYNIAADAWSAADNFPQEKIGTGVAVLVDGVVYRFGGCSSFLPCI